MIRASFPHRPTGLALCLLVLITTAGCAHFHNAEVRAEQRREEAQPTAPALAEAPPQAEPAPAPSAAPAPPAPVAVPAAIPPPARAAPVPEVAAPASPVPAPSSPVPAPAPPPAEQTPPESAPEAAVAPPTPPSPVPAPPPVAAVVSAPATDSAIIIFANTPGARCGSCETLKLSVAPSGQVLIERGAWASADHRNWRYKRSRAQVSPARAAAFATRLSTARPAGTQAIGSGCPTGADGLSIEWIEADRHDRLNVTFGCPTGAGSQLAERLRHAPDLLGLHQLDLP